MSTRGSKFQLYIQNIFMKPGEYTGVLPYDLKYVCDISFKVSIELIINEGLKKVRRVEVPNTLRRE